MQRNQHLKVVGGIAIVGVLAAQPFTRRDAPDAVVTPQKRPTLDIPLHLPAEAAQSPAVGLRDQDPFAPALVAAPVVTGSRLEDNGLPPELPEMYQPLIEGPTPRSTPAPVAAPASVPASASAPQTPRSLQLEEPRVRIRQEESLPAPRTRTHRIADGDTLERIAQRYWNDASLADALFEANRDRLSAPDPLPIGVELRIPPPPERVITAKPAVEAVESAVEELPPPVRPPVPAPANSAASDDEELTPIVRD
jgi:phage tail protein X